VGAFTLERDELELLAETARTMDEIDKLAAVILRDGVTAVGSTGQPRAHPAVAEVRQHRLALSRLLAALALPAVDGSTIRTPTSLRAANASRSRGRRAGGAA